MSAAEDGTGALAVRELPDRGRLRVALVTGAAGGIGLATCLELSARGYAVVATARDRRRAEGVVAALRAANPHARALGLALDVADAGAWRAAVARVLAELGAVDLLVNNAGVVEPGRADELAHDAVERQVDVNVLGVVHGCRAVLPLMRARGAGAIVNVASLAGIVPMPHEAVYCATKHAVRGFSFALREELRGSGVSVTVVSCGSVATPQLDTELEHDGTWMSFVDPPLAPRAVAATIADAALGRRAEVLIPAVSGLLSRVLMVWPAALAALTPLLKRLGARNMARLRAARWRDSRERGMKRAPESDPVAQPDRASVS